MIDYDSKGFPTGDEDGYDPGEHRPDLTELTFMQRLYGALSDLADMEAYNPDEIISKEDVAAIISYWSFDPPIGDLVDGVTLGLDQMKLFEGMRHNNFTEESLETRVLVAFNAIENMAPPEFAEEGPEEEVDQIDLMIHELDFELEATAAAVAYMTAALNHDSATAHEIIREEGCSLVHILTNWFVMYMMTRQVLPESDNEIEGIKAKIRDMGMENAKIEAMTREQKREMIEDLIENLFGGGPPPFDQDDDND